MKGAKSKGGELFLRICSHTKTMSNFQLLCPLRIHKRANPLNAVDGNHSKTHPREAMTLFPQPVGPLWGVRILRSTGMRSLTMPLSHIENPPDDWSSKHLWLFGVIAPQSEAERDVCTRGLTKWKKNTAKFKPCETIKDFYFSPFQGGKDLLSQ